MKCLQLSILLSLFIHSACINYASAIVSAGKTMIARGDVNAISNEDDTTKRQLKRRSPIYNEDVVTTGSNSKTQLRMTDGGMIALKENSELIISQYQYNSEGKKGSVVMELVKGGLRSVTGAIKAEKGDYQLNTPVGSIGIRGTHYEVELIGDTLWIAVWDGAVDLDISSGTRSDETLSLGVGENYAYASIDPQGKVTTYIEPPEVFEQGMSSETTDVSTEEGTEKKNKSSQSSEVSSEEVTVVITTEEDLEPNYSTTDIEEVIKTVEESTEFISNDKINTLIPSNIHELVTNRQGSITYSDAFVNEDSGISNFSAGMNINFDSGLISDGRMSFNDAQSPEQWNAVFNGNMNITDVDVLLEVDITFASHGNNLADGNISAEFIDVLGLDAVTGKVELFELDTDISVDASYTIKNK